MLIQGVRGSEKTPQTVDVWPNVKTCEPTTYKHWRELILVHTVRTRSHERERETGTEWITLFWGEKKINEHTKTCTSYTTRHLSTLQVRHRVWKSERNELWPIPKATQLPIEDLPLRPAEANKLGEGGATSWQTLRPAPRSRQRTFDQPPNAQDPLPWLLLRWVVFFGSTHDCLRRREIW